MTEGDIYTAAGNGTFGYSGDGGPATSAQLGSPEGVVVDAVGNVILADSGNDRVRVVAAKTGTFYGISMTTGDIYTVAGNGTPGYSGDHGPATSAELSDPQGVAVDAVGNLLIADAGNNRIGVVAAKTGTFYGVSMTTGDIYTVAGNGTPGYSGDSGPATSAQLQVPAGIAVDAVGNLIIGDTFNYSVRVVAAKTGTFYGMSMTTGDIYTVAGNGTPGYSGDSGPATSAQLAEPEGVAVDALGNLIIADTFNSRIRVVAAKAGTFYGISMIKGDINTVAGNGTSNYSGDGGPAAAAELNLPQGVAVNATGDLLIADQHNNRIRLAISSRWDGGPPNCALPAGDICTAAGNGTPSYAGDGGPATSAELDTPFAVAVDPQGNFFAADTLSNRIREVASSGLQIITSTLPQAVVGRVYSSRVHAQGGTAPYTWRLGSGSLPPGLTLDASTGVISNTPRTAGTSSFTLKVTDAEYPRVTVAVALSISVS